MRLFSGLEIIDPLRLVVGYTDWMWHRYDGVPVEQDDVLQVCDMRVSRGLVSYLYEGDIQRILTIQEVIDEALFLIPRGIDLIDVPAAGPIPGEDALRRVFTAMCALYNIKLAKATKILHKKRPRLIVIFDSVVERYYNSTLVPTVSSRSYGQYFLDLTCAFLRDMHSVETELRDIRRELDKRLRPLSHCRVLELMIWAVRNREADWFRGRAA